LDLCAQVPDCAAHLGGDPRAAMGEAIRLTDAGHCSEHFTDLRHRAGNLLRTRETRNLIPALIRRVLRCGEQDYAAFSALEQWLVRPQETAFAGLGWSNVLWFNIVVSEYMPIPPPTVKEASDYQGGLWFLQYDPTYFANASAAWPAYNRDEHWGQLPDTAVPVLMLQGGLDPLTLDLGIPLRDHLHGAHQTYVEVPYSTHDVFVHSNLKSDPNTTCGGLLTQQFLADPKASLDTSCTSDLQAPTFTADDDLLMAMFGTTDMWGDE
jgi:pimeloyl-ACP methyl ester carboxylesterase